MSSYAVPKYAANDRQKPSVLAADNLERLENG